MARNALSADCLNQWPTLVTQSDPKMVIDHGVKSAKGRNKMDTNNNMIGLEHTPEDNILGTASKINSNLRYFKEGREYIDIHVYAAITQRSVAAVRASIEQGNRVRKMRAIRVGSRYYILKDEFYVFPYINKGKGIDRVYHFEEDGELHLCDQCTNGGGRCPKTDEEGNWNGK